MSFVECGYEKEVIDNDQECRIFNSSKERKEMAIQMNIGGLWLYSDAMWCETSAQIILEK